jgi:hypothetical protein
MVMEKTSPREDWGVALPDPEIQCISLFRRVNGFLTF